MEVIVYLSFVILIDHNLSNKGRDLVSLVPDMDSGCHFGRCSVGSAELMSESSPQPRPFRSRIMVVVALKGAGSF